MTSQTVENQNERKTKGISRFIKMIAFGKLYFFSGSLGISKASGLSLWYALIDVSIQKKRNNSSSGLEVECELRNEREKRSYENDVKESRRVELEREVTDGEGKRWR